MDIRQLLTEGRHALARADLPGLEAEILLGYVLGRNRAWFYANPEAEVSEADVSHYRALLHRRRDGEPVAYLTGVREFWSMVLTVTPDVLIPRPETELLVDRALKLDLARGAIRAQGYVVIVESYMDVLQAHQAGIGNIVARLRPMAVVKG